MLGKRKETEKQKQRSKCAKGEGSQCRPSAPLGHYHPGDIKGSPGSVPCIVPPSCCASGKVSGEEASHLRSPKSSGIRSALTLVSLKPWRPQEKKLQTTEKLTSGFLHFSNSAIRGEIVWEVSNVCEVHQDYLIKGHVKCQIMVLTCLCGAANLNSVLSSLWNRTQMEETSNKVIQMFQSTNRRWITLDFVKND